MNALVDVFGCLEAWRRKILEQIDVGLKRGRVLLWTNPITRMEFPAPEVRTRPTVLFTWEEVRGFSIKNNAPLGIYCQDSGSLAREFGEEDAMDCR